MKAERKRVHQCTGKGVDDSAHKPARLSVCLQLTTTGENPRRRAKAITLYPCDSCIKQITQKPGRALRVALARALQTMSKELRAHRGAA